jgi:pimeloyl-ACP methyl ester carboxylesterase
VNLRTRLRRAPGSDPTDVPLDVRSFRMPRSTPGTGRTFVLLHGIGLSHRSFTRLAEILSRTGDVISFDLPGFASTRTPLRPVSVAQYAAEIGRELDRIRTGPVIVVGHSMGAQFALELAVTRPDLVSHLIAIGPVTNSSRRTLRAQAVDLALDALREPPKTQLRVLIDYSRCGVPWFLTEAAVMRDYRTDLRMPDLTQPVLIIRGEHDSVARAPWCAWLSRQVPLGVVMTIPGQRHNVPHSAPAATATTITTFVRDTAQRNAHDAALNGLTSA